MKNKKIQKELQKQSRRAHERIGALVLIAGTLIGMIAVSTEARRVLSGLAIHPAFAVIEHNGKENETARHPVRLDDALRAPTITGI